jgi:hypothetical protein
VEDRPGFEGTEMKRTTARRQNSRPASRYDELDPLFVPVIQAFAGDRRVTYGGLGFGSRALRLDGKIFAMLSSRGQFVVKLPRDRVAELIRLGQGEYFDTGRDRVMKEWLAVVGDPPSWLGLAREAHRFATSKRD